MQIIKAWQLILPEVIVKGFKKCCISTGWMRPVTVCSGMAVRRMGMLGVSVRKMKGLTVKTETVTLIGKGRYDVTCFVYKVFEINSKIFFS